MQNKSLQVYGAIFFTVFMVLAGALLLMHRQVGHMKGRLEQLTSTQVDQPKLPESNLAHVDVSAPKRQRWSELQSQSQNAVLQVFSQINEFNWVEPYKSPAQKESRGSAFFINAEGDIITNAHVVSQAIYVTVQIPSVGKRRFEIEIIGVSPERDLALLRLTDKARDALKKELGVTKLPYLTLGDSDAVHRGDKIMALGFPLGQEGLKSTTGVVSGREHLPASGYFIQISAPINPGNSGGPSLDHGGRVIGVNSAGIPGAQNVGYIIPSNEVLLFLDQLENVVPEDGNPKLLRKPFMGVFFNSADDNLREFLGNPSPGGLYVIDVYKGSPFDLAGIKAGDMIYTMDSYPVDMHGEMSVPWNKEDRISLLDYVSRLKLGHKVVMEIYRKGKLLKVTIPLENNEPPIRKMYPGFEKIDYEMIGGFVFMPITVNHIMLLAQYAPKLIEYADPAKPIEPSLLITHVLLNSPASRLRTIGVGGIIAEVNGQRVKTLGDLRAAIVSNPQSKYLTFKTTDNQFAVIPVDDVLASEERLSAMYYYPVSDTFKEFKKRIMESRK